MNLKHFIRTFAGHLRNVIRNELFDIKELQTNVKYKNNHRKDRCFILGSGNSIKKHNLKLLENEIVMTQNHFHAHKDIGIIKPKYHCIVPMYQTEKCNDDWIEWFTSMEERLPHTEEFFMGLNTKAFVEKYGFFYDKRNYIQMGLYPLFMRRASIDLTKRIMHIPTVITQCLTIALYMGFKKIYLLGFDLDQPCITVRENVRFYHRSPIIENQEEKDFEKKFRDTGDEWFTMWLIWKQLLLLRKNAESRGIEIINITEAGLLDCFKRQSFKSVF